MTELKGQQGQDQHNRAMTGLGNVQEGGRVEAEDHPDESNEHHQGNNEEQGQAGVQYLAEEGRILVGKGLGHAVDDIYRSPISVSARYATIEESRSHSP